MATHSDQLEQSFSPENIKQLMKMLAAHFGSSSEFSLHDLRNGIDNTIVAIENNHLTGRNIGDCGSNLGLEVLRCEGKSQVKDSYGYRVFFKNGTVFRSSTMYFRDDTGKIVGSFCINTDITHLLGAKNYLDDLLNSTESNTVEEFFPHDVSELLDTLIENYTQNLNKDPSTLSKEEKMDAIRFFDSKGAFLVTKAGPKICKYLNISKGTLYSYLAAIREARDT